MKYSPQIEFHLHDSFKIKIMKTIYVILSFFLFNIGFGQSAKIAVADKKYAKYAYIDAIKIYEKIAEKGYESAKLYQKIGNSYYFNGELEKAAKWYGNLFNLNEEIEAEYYFRYSQALKSIKDYENANKYLLLFYQKNKSTNDSNNDYDANYLSKIEENSGKYFLDTTSINSEYLDYGTAYFKDKIVFTSARKKGALYQKKHHWTNQNFTDLYIVTLENDSIVSAPENFSSTINTKFNESSPAFAKDGKTMYFTRNNYLNGKKRKADNKTTWIKIYKATFSNNKWGNVVELPFNNDNYSTAHPSLSADEKTLYFSSDMPGGYGGADIYKVAIKENNTYGKPENLGTIINTTNRETFPFMAANGILYFASDGLLGLGGLDIFESNLINNVFSTPINLGKPINSSNDDFSFIINTQKKGFLSSNRANGKGFDDIYSFTKCSTTVFGIIKEGDSKFILPNAKVSLLDKNNNLILDYILNKNAEYAFEIDCKEEYYIRVSNIEYETKEIPFKSNINRHKTELNINLDRTVFPIEIGTDLAKLFNISILYFDLDKWNIRPDAAYELEKIIAVMEEYPTMEIAINSHTDSRQTHEYNELLSSRRAKSTLEYMVEKGINPSRLTANGYGETKLINECSNDVYCTEEAHQLNRRSEFIVTKIE